MGSSLSPPAVNSTALSRRVLDLGVKNEREYLLVSLTGARSACEHAHMAELTYASYLDLGKLLALQKPRSSPPEHDETLFIIIHQTYELWFKQLLHEFDKIKSDFSAGDLFGAIHRFKRTRTIMKVLVAQVDILETMTPSSFSSFRDRLETPSGFQSVQFREMEFALGYKRESTLNYLRPDFTR